MALDYNQILFFIPAYGTIPIANISIGLAYNILLVIALIVFFLISVKNQKYYSNGFLKKYACYLLGGLPGEGKTRFMTKVAKDIVDKENKTIIIANYLNGYTTMYYSSLNDFFLIQRDIQTLGLIFNFTPVEKIEIIKYFKNYFDFDYNDIEDDDEKKDILKKIEKLKKIKDYRYNIVCLGDEFHNYFHNRKAMKNFSGIKGEKFLEMIHQTRHSNQLLLLSAQDTDTLDLDFRQISDKEIEVREWLGCLFFGFNLYKYLNLKYQNKADNQFFRKINILPYWWFNGYLFYEMFNNLNYKIDKIQKFIFIYLNKWFKKNYTHTFQFKQRFEKYKLNYNTKFNVNTHIDIYKAGDLFDYILKKNGFTLKKGEYKNSTNLEDFEKNLISKKEETGIII